MSAGPKEKARAIPRVVWALGFVSLLTDVASDMAVPLLPKLLEGLGATVVTLGILEGVAEATSAATKLWGGVATDRGRSARTLVVFGYGLAALTRPLMAVVPSGAMVVALRALDRVGKGVRTAPRDLVIARAAGARRGLAFGIHRGLDNLGAFVGGGVAFLLLGPLGLSVQTVILLTIVPGLASTLLAWKEVPADTTSTATSYRGRQSTEHSSDEERRGPAPTEARGADGGLTTTAPTTSTFSPALRRLLVATFVFGLGASADTFLVAQLLALGLPLPLAPLAWISLQLGKAVLNAPGGMLADRFGAKIVLLVAWVAYGISYLCFAFAPSIATFWMAFAIYAIHHGLAEGADKAWLLSLAPDGAPGRALGYHHAILGITAFVANVAFGILYLRYGSIAFAFCAIPSLLAAAIAVTIAGRRSSG